MNEKKITFELFVTFCKEPVLQVKIMLNQCFLLLAQSTCLFLHTCVLPPTPTDGMAINFSLIPMP